MELKSTLDYKGYTIKAFSTTGKDIIKLYLGEDSIDYSPETEEEYEGSVHGKEGIEAAKQYIDELE